MDLGLDGTEALLESVSQKDGIGNNMKLVLRWHIWNWDDENSGIGDDVTWEWVAWGGRKDTIFGEEEAKRLRSQVLRKNVYVNNQITKNNHRTRIWGWQRGKW